MNELRWETRLLAVVTATLVVFGIAMTYGASSLVRTKDGGVAGGAFALTQLTGALLGGILMATIARIDYRRLPWRAPCRARPCVAHRVRGRRAARVPEPQPWLRPRWSLWSR